MRLEKDWWKLEPNDDDLADAMWGCGRDEEEEEEDDLSDYWIKRKTDVVLGEEPFSRQEVVCTKCGQVWEDTEDPTCLCSEVDRGRILDEPVSEETKKKVDKGRLILWMQGVNYESKKKHIENGGTMESWRL
jgi:hypothetical protein